MFTGFREEKDFRRFFFLSEYDFCVALSVSKGLGLCTDVGVGVVKKYGSCQDKAIFIRKTFPFS